MVYDEKLAERIRQVLPKEKGIIEKQMFGGIAFMLDGKMFIGVVKDELMVRVGKENHEKAISMPGARTMNFTGREMKGYVFVNQEGLKSPKELGKWISMSMDFVKTVKKQAK